MTGVTNIFDDYCGPEFATFTPAAEAAMKHEIDALIAQPGLTAQAAVTGVSAAQDRVYDNDQESGASDSRVRDHAWHYLVDRIEGLTFDALYAAWIAD